jgi:hypothetical protein
MVFGVNIIYYIILYVYILYYYLANRHMGRHVLRVREIYDAKCLNLLDKDDYSSLVL